MENSRNGVIFDIQRFSIHDGPGIRTLVFMKGCPLRCLWCDNPESQDIRNDILYIESNCIRCRQCVVACPVGAISEVTFRINREACTDCELCTEVCPANAKKVAGRKVTVDDALEEVEKDRLFYETSGGGLTVGGGEPTMQHRFVANLLERCRQRNIHTAIETCGYVQWDRLEEVLKHLDLVLFDIKGMDREEHIRLTGVSNDLILENAKRIAEYGIPMLIRVPIIPGYNDSETSMRSLAKFASALGNVPEIELLPYHRMGESKYEWLGRRYALKNLGRPNREQIEGLRRIMMQHGLRVHAST